MQNAECRMQNYPGNWKLVIGNWKLQSADVGKREQRPGGDMTRIASIRDRVPAIGIQNTERGIPKAQPDDQRLTRAGFGFRTSGLIRHSGFVIRIYLKASHRRWVAAPATALCFNGH
jgi:hypothetical protein